MNISSVGASGGAASALGRDAQTPASVGARGCVQASRKFFESSPSDDLKRFWSRENIRRFVRDNPPSFRVEVEPAPPLVNRRISQQSKRPSPYDLPKFGVQIDQYASDVRIRRGFVGLSSAVGGGRRGSVDAFSEASRRRLGFTARNAFPKLVSQFGMTYHNDWPDGLTVKKHLNRFLVWLRRNLPGVGYLWIFEFQSRGAPHFHVFLTLPASPALGVRMAAAWNRIAARGDDQHLAFHRHERNFIEWDMGSGSYLTKYLQKEAQKAVPDGFGWAGRFWGASRSLVPAPVVHSTDTGHSRRDLARVIRGLGRWHEHKLKRHGRRSHVRRHLYNALVPQGSRILDRLIS